MVVARFSGVRDGKSGFVIVRVGSLRFEEQLKCDCPDLRGLLTTPAIGAITAVVGCNPGRKA
jgi:hypothetical protein